MSFKKFAVSTALVASIVSLDATAQELRPQESGTSQFSFQYRVTPENARLAPPIAPNRGAPTYSPDGYYYYSGDMGSALRPARRVPSVAPVAPVAAPQLAAAEEPEEPTPLVQGDALFEFWAARGHDSDNPNNERANAFARTEIAPTVTLNDNFFITGVAVFEQIDSPPPGQDSFMNGEGAFIEELNVNYVNGRYQAFAGKFNPGFGTAWDIGRGIWAEDFALDYELTEKIGFGGAATVGNENAGDHTLTGATFFADTSILSRSAFTERGRTKLSSGGVSNTEDFSSFTVSLDGENVAGISDLSYHLGYRKQAAGDYDVGGFDEDGYAAAVNYSRDLTDRINADILLEYVALNNTGGSSADARYYYASLVNTLDEKWNVKLAYTKRDTLNSGGTADVNDRLFQATGGYDFGNGLTLEGGWRSAEVSNVRTDSFGGLARYTVGF